MDSGHFRRAPSQLNGSQSEQQASIDARSTIGRDQTVLPRFIPALSPIGS